MFSVEDLRNAITDLFRGGIGNGYTADEVEDMLDGIDFTTLHQAVWHEMMPIYAYSLRDEKNKKFNYCGPDLFGKMAVYLYEEPMEFAPGAAFIFRSVELWLLEDMTIVPVTYISIDGGGEYNSEYRVVKEHGPWKCDLELDLEMIIENINEMCKQVETKEYPIYEL